MRITFVIASADLAGGCRVIAIYARKLRERGHDVIVVAPNPRPTWRQRVRKLLRKGELDFSEPPHHLALMGAPHELLAHRGPVTAEDVPDADVVVATWWETAEWIQWFPASKGAKAYFIQHHEVCMDGQPPERVNATWRLPYHKITISSWLVGLAKELGDEDVTFVPNSVDMTQFHAPPRVKNQRPTVGMMYNAVPWKGADVCLAAIEKLKAELPELRVVAFGAQSPDVPLPSYVEFTRQPPQDRIRDLYAQCDVWLCGSRLEGFYLPMLEAMACRCPVVSTRVGGPIDVIREGENGFLADVEDVEGLTRGLREVLTADPSSWQRMSDAALATAQSYTWDDATDRFYEGLERAIQKSDDMRRPAKLAG